MDIYESIRNFYERVKTEKRVIGKSVLGRSIFAVKIGRGNPVGIATYAIHGREFITAKLAVAHYAREITGSLWIVPLVNPDGALLSQRGLASVENKKYRRALERFSAQELRLWKANARGVDLNVNFDADWGKGVQNLKTAGAQNYIGEKPFSEPETLALKNFTQEILPDYTLSYHTKGEEIYWYYYQSLRTCSRDKRLAEVISRSTGYPLKRTQGSVGGYKDWCIKKLKIPAFTVEVGDDELTHPIGEEGLENILQKNGDTPRALSEAVAKLYL